MVVINLIIERKNAAPHSLINYKNQYIAPFYFNNLFISSQNIIIIVKLSYLFILFLLYYN